jgi:glycosyltransferase involved in cell wall biosynthesis
MRLLFIDRSTKLETVRDLERRARGGMVTSLFKVSDYLSMCGHDVTVFSDIENTGVTKHGVKWLDECFGQYDVLIANRGVGDGFPQVKARHRILWTHDLPHSGFSPEPRTLHAFDCVVFMSRYAERVWRTFYNTIGRSVLIPNGVNKKLFFPRTKDMNYLIYASAPNRGLSKVPFIFDCIKTHSGRDLRMHAYSNMSVLHPNENAKDHNEVLDDGYALEYESNAVRMLDPVPQQRLAEELGKASLMILPTPFPEICSNIILQSLASGTPVITTGQLGSAGEWIRHKRNGMLTEFITNDYMVHVVEMIRNACYVLEDGKRHQRMIRRAARTQILTWREVGKKWNRMIGRL